VAHYLPRRIDVSMRNNCRGSASPGGKLSVESFFRLQLFAICCNDYRSLLLSVMYLSFKRWQHNAGAFHALSRQVSKLLTLPVLQSISVIPVVAHARCDCACSIFPLFSVQPCVIR
jgi:hypothetical protein